jgi:hypothetical protein
MRLSKSGFAVNFTSASDFFVTINGSRFTKIFAFEVSPLVVPLCILSLYVKETTKILIPKVISKDTSQLKMMTVSCMYICKMMDLSTAGCNFFKTWQKLLFFLSIRFLTFTKSAKFKTKFCCQLFMKFEDKTTRGVPLKYGHKVRTCCIGYICKYMVKFNWNVLMKRKYDVVCICRNSDFYLFQISVFIMVLDFYCICISTVRYVQ